MRWLHLGFLLSLFACSRSPLDGRATPDLQVARDLAGLYETPRPDLAAVRDLASSPHDDLAPPPDLQPPPRFAFGWSIRSKGGSNVWQFVLGDLNGDGKLDIAAASGGTQPMGPLGGATVLLGNGDGTFGPATDYAAGPHPRSITLGDFNEDKIPDLALATGGDFDNKVAGTVEILFGRGDGTFAAAKQVRANPSNGWVRTADLDRDGHLDLVVNGWDTFPSVACFIATLLGRGDGSFGPPVTVYTDTSIQTVAVADFDRDGKSDVATIIQGEDKVAVLPGRGDGTLSAATFYSIRKAPFQHQNADHITAVDIDADGDTDIVTTSASSVAVLANDGKGGFGALAATQGSMNELTLDRATYADFDGDGKVDLLGSLCTDFYRVMAGAGNGQFEQNGLLERSRSGTCGWVESGDVDGDKRIDAVLAGDGAFFTLLNRRP